MKKQPKKTITRHGIEFCWVPPKMDNGVPPDGANKKVIKIFSKEINKEDLRKEKLNDTLD